MKKFLLLFSALLLLLLVTACGDKSSNSGGTSDSDKAATETVTIGYQKGNSLHILKSLGYLDEALKEQGVKVEWKELATGGLLLEALNAGSIDFGHAADANAVFAQASGMPLVYVASALPNPEGLAILVHGDSNIQSASDLKGKTVAIGKGWNSHYLLMKALQKEGLTSNDVRFAYVKDASEGRAAFTAGEVDALGFWDPFLASLELDEGAKQLFNGDGFTNNRTYYFATEKFSNDHSDILQTIIKEIQRSDTWANENKKELAELLAKELGIDVKPLQETVNRKTYGIEKITSDIVAEQQDIANIFLQEGLIDEEISVADRVTEEPAWFPDDLLE